MHIFSAFACWCLLAGDAEAQWAVGARLGINASTMDFSNNPDYRLEGPGYTQGLVGGLTVQYISQPHVGVQFELNYMQKGWSETEDTLTNTRYRRHINYVELPFLAHANIGKGKFRMIFDFGPYAAYALSSREIITDISTGTDMIDQYTFEEDRDNRLDYGLIVGSGFEYKLGRIALQVAARYTFGLGNISKIKTTESEVSQNRTISLSAGFLYMFGQEKKPTRNKDQQ